MVCSDNQDELSDWLCTRLGIFKRKIQCLGYKSRGIIQAVVGFDHYSGASFMMHVGVVGPVPPSFLLACFDYAFNVCRCQVLFGLISSTNVKSLKLSTKLGFKVIKEFEGAHPGELLVLMAMERGECRYLNRNSHGFKSSSATAS